MPTPPAGEIFTGFSRDAIETTYARALGDARNQYTLGYLTHATPSSTHREIEVQVARPDLTVTAKEGYYPVGLGAEVRSAVCRFQIGSPSDLCGSFDGLQAQRLHREADSL